MFNKNKKPLIEFVSIIEGLDLIDEVLPKPSNKYIPDWWRSIPTEMSIGRASVRQCPSFPDFFSSGYVVPMWMDSLIQYDESTESWNTKSSHFVADWAGHGNDQMIDYVRPSLQGKSANFVFKANSPWRIITPPGYSVLQLPMFYHFNREWSVMPGIVDTDIYHDVNQQVLYHGEGKEIFIKRGEPLAMYLPFERKKFMMQTRYQTEKDRAKFVKNTLDVFTKFLGQGSYRSLQRERDK